MPPAAAFAAPSFTLVEDGVCKAPLVIDAGAPPATRQAAHELARYIEKISGARPEVHAGCPIPPRIIRLDAARPVSLVSGDRVLMEIVVPEESGSVAAYAGKELKTFLEQALDRPVPLVKAPTGEAIPILLGDCDAARARGVDVTRMPYDGFFHPDQCGRAGHCRSG